MQKSEIHMQITQLIKTSSTRKSLFNIIVVEIIWCENRRTRWGVVVVLIKVYVKIKFHHRVKLRKSTKSNNLKLISDGTNQKIQLGGVRAAWDTLRDLVEVTY